MSKFMKMLNNVSRSQAIYRRSRISAADLQPGHYSFVLAICHSPGRSQEELARELCINKSTVARTLNHLENHGYITRTANPEDKRQFLVYPTEKMLGFLPDVRAVSGEWNNRITEGIPENELEIFHSVLNRIEEKSKQIIREL